MRAGAAILTGLLWLAAGAVQAKQYYVNKGTLYRLGDNRGSASRDADFVDTYPVVGRQWIQAFTVDQDDYVKVGIEVIRGVDDCPYCKIIISIDDIPMGRLFEENNKVPFTTPAPLARRVRKGVVHYLKIESVGLEADDFVIGNVVVETDANVKLLDEPIVKDAGDPMPVIRPSAEGACGNSPLTREWMPGFSADGPRPVSLKGGRRAFAVAEPLANLAQGRALEFEFQIRAVALRDRVGQPLEIAIDDDFKNAWVLLFDASGVKVEHANLRVDGRYTDDAFPIPEFRAGGWNKLKVELCKGGSARLYINGRDTGVYLPTSRAAVRVRAMASELLLRSTLK